MTEEERYEKEMADEDARIQSSPEDEAPASIPHFEENAGRMFLDLQRELSLSPEFINKVMRVYQDMILADKSGEHMAFRQHMTELLRLCDYNPSLLAPVFFPDFEGGGPMTFWERPHAIAMLSMTPTGTITVQASRQVGKCLSVNALCKCKVDGEEKTMTMGDIFEYAA